MARQAHGKVRVMRMDAVDQDGEHPVRTIPAKFWSDPAPTNPFRKTIPGTKDPIFVIVPDAGPAPDPVEAKPKGKKSKTVQPEDLTEE